MLEFFDHFLINLVRHLDMLSTWFCNHDRTLSLSFFPPSLQVLCLIAVCVLVVTLLVCHLYEYRHCLAVLFMPTYLSYLTNQYGYEHVVCVHARPIANCLLVGHDVYRRGCWDARDRRDSCGSACMVEPSLPIRGGWST